MFFRTVLIKVMKLRMLFKVNIVQKSGLTPMQKFNGKIMLYIHI